MIPASARHAALVCLQPLLSLLPRHLAYGKHTRLRAPAISKRMLCAVSSQKKQFWEISLQNGAVWCEHNSVCGNFLKKASCHSCQDTMPRCLQLLCLCNHRFTAKPVCLRMKMLENAGISIRMEQKVR